MGSAFNCDNLGGPETVLFLMWPDDSSTDLVAHLPHPECAEQHPHRMHECGRFAESPTMIGRAQTPTLLEP